MNNKWFRLALVSIVGILISSLGLYVMQFTTGAASHDPNQQMQHGGSVQTMAGMSDQTMNHGQGAMQYTSQAPAPQYPNPGMGYGPNANSGMGYAPNANPYAQAGYSHNPFANQNNMEYQIYLMRQQINQLQQQLNNANNSGGSMSNNGGGGMSSMPMM